MVSKGKEDLQIISSACAVTLLAVLSAAFMLPQQRERLPRACNVLFRILQAGRGCDSGDTGQDEKIPISARPVASYPHACPEVFVFETLPMILYKALEVSDEEGEEGGECMGELAGGQIILPSPAGSFFHNSLNPG